MPNTTIDLNEHPTKTDVYMGPTVTEYTEMRIEEINRQIANLTMERSRLRRLNQQYQGSQMLWAEHAATQAERFLKPISE